MHLPDRINTGSAPLDRCLGQIIDYIHASTLRQSPGVLLTELPNGTTLKITNVPPQAAAASSGGFTGNVWVPTSGGTRVNYQAVDSTKVNIKVEKTAAPPVVETNEGIPSVWGPDQFWYAKANQSGDIIVP